jgi:hypothetical protein
MLTTAFSSVSEIEKAFVDELSCILYLESLRWDREIVSPFDSYSKVYACSQNKYRCRNTKRYFNVRTYTIFHNSKLDLRTWFAAIWLVGNDADITSVALATKIGVTQKTAWLLLNRIRKYLGIAKIQRPQINVNDIEVRVTPDKLKMTDWFTQL